MEMLSRYGTRVDYSTFILYGKAISAITLETYKDSFHAFLLQLYYIEHSPLDKIANVTTQ